MENKISKIAVNRRTHWIEEIRKLSGDFGTNVNHIEKKLDEEIAIYGPQSLIDHLRLCGNIPEIYSHDSSEEKLYSKYTDALLAKSFTSMHMKSLVLTERSDAADVEVFADKFSFVADAKSFRLSRTAKNQKDFKISAMDSWKRGKPFAIVVCPIYQLPEKSSQIYAQASAHNVCIFSYSHLSLIVSFSYKNGAQKAEGLLEDIFKSVSALNISKDASDYWSVINQTMLAYADDVKNLWESEKQAALEAVSYAREESLRFLAQERERIMRMNHEEALREILRIRKIDSKIKTIKSVTNSGILDIRS